MAAPQDRRRIAIIGGAGAGLVALVLEHDLAPSTDDGLTAFACELVLEALVARRKISRSDRGRYGRAQQEQGRRRRGDAPPEGFTG